MGLSSEQKIDVWPGRNAGQALYGSVGLLARNISLHVVSCCVTEGLLRLPGSVHSAVITGEANLCLDQISGAGQNTCLFALCQAGAAHLHCVGQSKVLGFLPTENHAPTEEYVAAVAAARCGTNDLPVCCSHFCCTPQR